MSSNDPDPIPFAKPVVGEAELREVREALESGWLTMGPKTLEFERAFAAYVGAPHARSFSSCTAALHVALVARGIGAGDEVIAPSLTFAATANVVDQVGARPVFVEVDEATLNLTAATVAPRIGPRTRALIAVHFAGLPCQLEALRALCRDHGLFLIEDAAHAVGTHYRGEPVGAHGDAVCFSFYANKNMTTGEGGMLTTGSEEVARRCETLRLHGMSRDAWKRYSAEGSWRYDILEAGFKYNMTDLNAALGLAQLRQIEDFIARRDAACRAYAERLARIPGLGFQAEPGQGDRHARHLFVVRVPGGSRGPGRDRVIAELASRRIGFSVHFQPLHLMTHYRQRWGYAAGNLPITERVAEELLSLPLFPQMSETQVDRVVDAVRAAFRPR